MNTLYFSRVFATLLLALILLSPLAYFSTANAQGSAGVGMVPATTDPKEQLKPGEVKQLSIKVSNLSDVDQLYYLSKRNILGVREGGVPIFAEPSSETNGFEISDWITLDKEEVFIKAREEVDIAFLISVPNEVSPGSHFGSVIISVDPPKLRVSGASIGYEVAHLIHLRIEGEVEEAARIRQFSTSKYIYGSTNVDFNVKIENEGNTYIKPTGPLEIINMFGKRVTMLQFNESQAGVLPKMSGSDLDSNGTRSFDINWSDETPGFGRYEALLSVVYGVEGKMSTISSTVTFWILPMNIITPALVTLLVFCVIIFMVVKLYVRRQMAVAASGSSRRLVRSRRQGQFPVLLVFISMLAVSALIFIVLLLMFA
jgi:hypothetical protein